MWPVAARVAVRAPVRDRLTYVEADLPEMAERKRAALERIGSLGDHHRVREVDALRDDDGPGTLAAIAADIDAGEGLAIITEGLLGYLSTDAVAGCGGGSRARSTGLPPAVHLRPAPGRRVTPQVRVFRMLLSAFVRGRVYLHFSDAREAEGTARGRLPRRPRAPCGGGHGRDRGPGSQLANILEASTTLPPEASKT